MKIENLAYTYVYDIYFKPGSLILQNGAPQAPINIKVPSKRRLTIDEIKVLLNSMCAKEDDLDPNNLAHISMHEVISDPTMIDEIPLEPEPELRVDPKAPILPFPNKKG